MERLATAMGVHEFVQHVTLADEDGKLVSYLKLKDISYGWRSCVFLDDKNMCTVYEVRPDQCRAFPFIEVLWRKPGRWRVGNCEGLQVTDEEKLHVVTSSGR